ncbi:MAG: CDGSH iron-sulfur domain-containing protein [Candidatus Dadabacteria bacterium]|nr:MAG: CDGSH iron-sulfur domain-containing protein [Candidatus Dadabacteria bacterium]
MEDKPKTPSKKPYVMEMEPGTYFWCACGRSQNQPFCDGSHQGTSFSPIKFEVEEKRKIAWCGCKLTSRAPLCDGTHKTLSDE